MPGIFGLITNIPREQAQSRLHRMSAPLRHESSYQIGNWSDEEQGVYVGWSNRGGQTAGGSPSQNEIKDITLVFAGEVFCAPDSRSSITGSGPASGAELIRLYESDAEFPAGLNGRFHGLLVDSQKKRIELFNDRYGMQRIYYHQAADAFYFAAEAKSLLAVLPALRKPNYRSLGEYVSHGCVLENRTIFQEVQVLPPASSWTFRNGALESKSSYFEPREWEEQARLDPEAYYQELREAFTRNLPRYFGGQQAIGMSLTGGLDTRMILAWQKSAPGSLPCYSFAGSYRDCQDVTIARKVARSYGQSHSLIPVGKDFLSKFPGYAERTVYLSDGCAAVVHSADLYANEKAAGIAPIRMTGNYGGEVLRRVRAFKPTPLQSGLFSPGFLEQIETARKTYGHIIEGHPLSFAVFRQAPWHHYGLLSLEQTQVSVRSPYLDNDLVNIVFRAPDSVLTSNEISLRLIRDGSTELSKIRTDRGLGGNTNGLSAAVKRAYLEFTFKAEYAYDYGMPQWVSRTDHLASRLHLEKIFLGRHKFYHYRVWYRDALRTYVRETLTDSRSLSRPYLDKGGALQVIEGHLDKGFNYTTEIHKLLTLELMHRLFFDSQ